MINLSTLLSTFNERGTLLKWLVALEKALNTSTLTNVEAVNQTPTAFQLKFTFADNTNVISDPIPIEKGIDGADGTSIVSVTAGAPYVQDGKTKTPITVNLSVGAPQSFAVEAQNGATGATGVGIAAIENDGYSYSDQYTITHITVRLTNGQVESFDVQAQNNTAYQELIIEAPESATSGTLTADQLTSLQSNPNKVIVFNGETFRLADDMSTEGYIIYSHVGMDNAQTSFIKYITITISTRGWVLTSRVIGNPVLDIVNIIYPVGKTIPQYYGEPTPAERFSGTSWEINTEMQGRVSIGSGGEYVFGATGGEATHKLAINELPEIGVYVGQHTAGTGAQSLNAQKMNVQIAQDFLRIAGQENGNFGKSFNLMQPYTVINYWKRTA